MDEPKQAVLETIAKGFSSNNKYLNEARERKFVRFINDNRTALSYDRAIDYELKNGSKEVAALIAFEAKQHSKAIEIYKSLEAWEDAAFAAKIAGKCDLARDFYRKAGNEFYALRMQENIDSAKKTI